MSALRAPAFAVAAAAALAAGIWLGVKLVPRGADTAPLEAGYALDAPVPLPDLELVDGDGMAFGEEGFGGAWSFLYFGYTYCPDICPLSLVELAGVKRLLASAYPSIDVRYYLVSVDPARDTAERIGEYVEYFDPEFRGLTGPLAEIDELARAAFVVYSIPEAAPGEPYLVGHSSTFTLVDPEGRIHAIFSSPFDVEAIAADFGTLVAVRGERG